MGNKSFVVVLLHFILSLRKKGVNIYLHCSARRPTYTFSFFHYIVGSLTEWGINLSSFPLYRIYSYKKCNAVLGIKMYVSLFACWSFSIGNK